MLYLQHFETQDTALKTIYPGKDLVLKLKHKRQLTAILPQVKLYYKSAVKVLLGRRWTNKRTNSMYFFIFRRLWFIIDFTCVFNFVTV